MSDLKWWPMGKQAVRLPEGTHGQGDSDLGTWKGPLEVFAASIGDEPQKIKIEWVCPMGRSFYKCAHPKCDICKQSWKINRSDITNLQ